MAAANARRAREGAPVPSAEGGDNGARKTQDGPGTGLAKGRSSTSPQAVTAPKEARAPKLKLTGEPNEDELQQSIADLLDWVLDEDVDWSHFPAGGYQLNGAARGRLYRLGLKPGFPDILICYSGGRDLWLEVKTRFGVTSQAQKKRHERLRANGHPVVVVRCVDDVLAALRTHKVPFKEVRLGGGYRGQSDQGAATSGTPQSEEGARPA